MLLQAKMMDCCLARGGVRHKQAAARGLLGACDPAAAATACLEVAAQGLRWDALQLGKQGSVSCGAAVGGGVGRSDGERVETRKHNEKRRRHAVGHTPRLDKLDLWALGSG